MNVQESESARGAWIWLPPVAGLAAAAWLSWEICPLTSPRSTSALVFESILYVLAAPFLSLLITWYLYRKVRARKDFELHRVLSQSAAIAVLFPPIVLLSLQRSGWFIFLTMLLLLGVASLVSLLRLPSDQHVQADGKGREMFLMPESRSPLAQFGASSAGVLCLQLSILAYVVNERFMMATLLCLSTLLLSRFRTEKPWRKTSGQAMTWELALFGSLALVLTIAALLHWFVLRRPLPPDSWATVIVRLMFHDEPKKPQVAQQPPHLDLAANDIYGSGGLFTGVILWDKEPHAIMLAPPLPELYPQTFNDKPVGIRFSGYYWFFKPPFRHPPRNSARIRGTPVKVGLRSSDDYPLLMEAHQDFGNLVDLDCCRKIQLVIRNSESRSGPVFCEMLLADTSLPADSALSESVLSLGIEPVPVDPAISGDDHPDRQQVLTFNIPKSQMNRRFNEITVRYHLSGSHAASSAHVAIEKFIFVP